MTLRYDRDRLIELVKRDALRFGDFTLSSGAKASYYIDCRLVSLHSEGLVQVSAGMLEKLGDAPIDAVGGPTLAADPIVAGMLALAGGAGRELRGFIVRKQAKEHGAGKLVEGPIRKGDRCVVVEDTATTGGSIQHAVNAVQAEGATVVRILVLIDRLVGAADKFAEQGIPFESLLTIRDLGL